MLVGYHVVEVAFYKSSLLCQISVATIAETYIKLNFYALLEAGEVLTIYKYCIRVPLQSQQKQNSTEDCLIGTL